MIKRSNEQRRKEEKEEEERCLSCNVLIISTSHEDQCTECRKRGRVFHSYVRDQGRVRDLCKECTLEFAGSREGVYFSIYKFNLPKIWDKA
jgi:uncharacterized protein (DUF983 family)